MNYRFIFKILLYITSLTIIYMILMEVTPPEYPFYFIPSLAIGLLAGIISWRRSVFVFLTIFPIPIYYTWFIFSSGVEYTVKKILSTGIILYIPIIYHFMTMFFMALTVYNVKKIFRGRMANVEES